MITRAKVVQILPDEGKGVRYKVRIPVLNGDGVSNNSTPDNQLSEACLCSFPGATNYIKVGDTVFVGFELNNLNKPVILGHLYTGESDARSKSTTKPDLRLRSLIIDNIENDNTSKVELPENTKIGDITYDNLQTLLNFVYNVLGNKDIQND